MSSPQNPHPTLPPSSRRLPPPCWSHGETVALIDAYREKWYSLRRGNLRASHWQEVADAIAVNSPLPSGSPQKTSVQCRHKMEKLRKRYRAEIQRAVSTPKGHRYCSSWVHFNRMDAMEKGSSVQPVVALNAQPIYRDADVEEQEEGDENINQGEDFYTGIPIPINRSFYGTGVGNGSGLNPFRIKIPGRPNGKANTTAEPKMYSRFNEYNNGDYGHSNNYDSGRFGTEKSGGGDGREKRTGEGGSNTVVDEMVEAIRMLGDGFVRMERMKMEMAREMEGMRMEMELKRTEMILESQQRVVDTIAKAILENGSNKRAKRMPSPES